MDNICGDLDFEDGGNPVVMNRILDSCGSGSRRCLCLSGHAFIMTVSDVPYVVLAEELGAGCADLATGGYSVSVGKLQEDSDLNRRKVVEVAGCSGRSGILQCLLWLSDPGSGHAEKGRSSGKTGYRRFASARDTVAKQESWVWVHCT